jgi:hypothetical protein
MPQHGGSNATLNENYSRDGGPKLHRLSPAASRMGRLRDLQVAAVGNPGAFDLGTVITNLYRIVLDMAVDLGRDGLGDRAHLLYGIVERERAAAQRASKIFELVLGILLDDVAHRFCPRVTVAKKARQETPLRVLPAGMCIHPAGIAGIMVCKQILTDGLDRPRDIRS